MTGGHEEGTLLRARDATVSFQPARLRDVPRRHWLLRFAFGATTSATAALVTIAFGPRVGGLLLAFPAILAASLTLVADEDSKAAAREDARGAVAGGIALLAFAAASAALLGSEPSALALALAVLAWLLVALGLYLAVWRLPAKRAASRAGAGDSPG